MTDTDGFTYWAIAEIFSTREKAEKWIAKHGDPKYNDIQEYELDCEEVHD